MLGERFGNVFVGVQPAFGFEGDPMRLLFEKGFAPDPCVLGLLPIPARGFRRACGAAFRHPRRTGIHARQAIRHVGRLLARPADRRHAELLSVCVQQSVRRHIAKRRAAATLISYLTPPVTNAGLYRGLIELKESLESWRGQRIR